MDEEIDDERKDRINRYGSAETYTLRRLRHELGTRLELILDGGVQASEPSTVVSLIGDQIEVLRQGKGIIVG